MHRLVQVSKQVVCSSNFEDKDVVWVPSELLQKTSNVARFFNAVNVQFSLKLVDYESLHQWSVSSPEKFWSFLWSFVGVVELFRGPSILNTNSMIEAVFFPEVEFNFARNCLAGNGEEAIVFSLEGSARRCTSWNELRAKVKALGNQLRADGIRKGDRIAGVVSNTPEAVVCMLATTAIGAIWSSISPDFGVEGIVERFGQIEPKLIFYSEGYFIKGKARSVHIENLRVLIPSCFKFIPIHQLDHYCTISRGDESFCFESTGFNDPAFIMFSSGTTGKPKCIVHRHGVLLQLMKEHQLHCDVRPGDRVFYYTTTTWMMWNWLVGVLASQATILLYDGSPFYPSSNVLFEFVAAERATFMGVSAKYIDSLKHSAEFKRLPNIATVRIIASTGSPLVPESFDFVYGQIKKDVNLASICGGTDILSCFILGCPIKPVKRGFVQCRGLGMDVQIWSEDERFITNTRGELVCCTPFPSMPIGFWNDDDNKTAYRAAYFSEWPNVWKQGDYALIDSEGHVIVLGRSDATLNPGGVRIGTAEIYRAVEALVFVNEAVCCGITLKPGEESVALFLVLKQPITDVMRGTIRRAINESATRHHVPAVIEEVKAIPKTHSGKIVELAVKNVIHGRPVKNSNSLVNPEALEEFKRFAL